MKSYTSTISGVPEYTLTLSRRQFVFGAIAGVAAASTVGLRGRRAFATVEGAHLDGDLVLGDPDAPIEIIEYASFTCPHCAAFHNDTLPGLKQNWIDTGKAKLVFRDFPLDQLALRAAMLARCAGEKSYFAFVDVLFKRQASWSRASDPMAALEQIGRLGGIGPSRFEACMNDEDLANVVLQSRVDAAQKFDISSTPTLIINGEKHAGALPYDELDRLLTTITQ